MYTRENSDFKNLKYSGHNNHYYRINITDSNNNKCKINTWYADTYKLYVQNTRYNIS